jgi:hypothetical protein
MARLLAAGMLLVGGAVGVGLAVDPGSGYAAGDTSLVVSPGSGRPDASFTTAYRWLASSRGRRRTNDCAFTQITFEWDGTVLGRATPTRSGSDCIATLRAVPPSGRYRATGTHTITVTRDSSVRAAYAIVQVQASQPPLSAPASPLPDPSDMTNPLVPDDLGTSGNSATPAAAQAADSPNVQNTGMTVVLTGFGTVLFLVGAGALGFIVWRRRQATAEMPLPALGANDETQQLPLRHRGAHRRAP